MTDSILAHVHETDESVATVEMTPPHDKRTETPEYKKAHSFLINRRNAACHICGVTKRTLRNPAKNVMHSAQMETHHYPIERSLVDACDPAKVHRDFPQVYDKPSLMAFVDTPANLLVLCDVCHRSLEHGIHHLLTQDWIVQRYLYAQYRVVASKADAAAVMAADEKIEETVAA